MTKDDAAPICAGCRAEGAADDPWVRVGEVTIRLCQPCLSMAVDALDPPPGWNLSPEGRRELVDTTCSRAQLEDRDWLSALADRVTEEAWSPHLLDALTNLLREPPHRRAAILEEPMPPRAALADRPQPYPAIPCSACGPVDDEVDIVVWNDELALCRACLVGATSVPGNPPSRPTADP